MEGFHKKCLIYPRGVPVVELRLITGHDCLAIYIVSTLSPLCTLCDKKQTYRPASPNVVSFTNKRNSWLRISETKKQVNDILFSCHFHK